jgi:hypothetical protein
MARPEHGGPAPREAQVAAAIAVVDHEMELGASAAAAAKHRSEKTIIPIPESVLTQPDVAGVPKGILPRMPGH